VATYALESLTCRQIAELVTEYLETALDPTDRARFERHIAGCDMCETYLQQLRLTIAELGRLRAGRNAR
jgi:anti-sigma factor RsiW